MSAGQRSRGRARSGQVGLAGAAGNGCGDAGIVQAKNHNKRRNRQDAVLRKFPGSNSAVPAIGMSSEVRSRRECASGENSPVVDTMFTKMPARQRRHTTPLGTTVSQVRRVDGHEKAKAVEPLIENRWQLPAEGD